MLNNLFKNNKLKKKIKYEGEDNTIFDYYLNNNNININFVPIIFKFIKDNHNNYINFEEEKLPKINDSLFIDKLAIDYLLTIIINTIYFISNSSNHKNFTNKLINNKTNNIKKNDNNKYMEITIEDQDIIYDSLESNSYFFKNDYENNYLNDKEYKNKLNQNIWFNKNLKKNIKDYIETSNTINENEFSNISESDILFNNNN